MVSPLSDAKQVVPLYPPAQLPRDAASQAEQCDQNGFIGNVHVPTLSVYLPAAANDCGVVVCPGGGYGGLACAHEGRDIARWLNDNGIAAFILKYRLPTAGHRHPAPLQDAQQAIRIVRSNAAAWGVDPHCVGIMGFSAGGHLAGSAMTHLQPAGPLPSGQVGQQSIRPDFGILIYPVVSTTEPFSHFGSRDNLLGQNPPAALAWSLSNELQVTSDTPPAFFAHSMDDPAVPVENSFTFAKAMRRAGVKAEVHLFPEGGHGYGMGAPGTLQSRWPAMCIQWLRQNAFAK
jgi:acetyl esterase/lipase